jgi:hypothetical protein
LKLEVAREARSLPESENARRTDNFDVSIKVEELRTKQEGFRLELLIGRCGEKQGTAIEHNKWVGL